MLKILERDNMLWIPSAIAIIVVILVMLYYVERDSKNEADKPDGCPTQEQGMTNIRQWMDRQSNRDMLRTMISTKIHVKASDLDEQVRECLLTHHLPEFLDAHLIELVKSLQSIKACDTAQVDKLGTEIRQYVGAWVDKVYNLLLHRCRCKQFDGDIPLAIMPYGDDDSLDATREMSHFAFMQKTDAMSDCVRRQFLKEVYGK